MRLEQSYESQEVQLEELDISDPKEARDSIRECIERGEFPILTVPKQYADVIKTGLVAHATWIGEPLLAGTLIRKPYLPEGEERVVLRIKIDPKRIQPRFTGPDKHYHGVVVFNGPIKPEEIEILTWN
jgi:hypothetical protein